MPGCLAKASGIKESDPSTREYTQYRLLRMLKRRDACLIKSVHGAYVAAATVAMAHAALFHHVTVVDGVL